MKLDPIVFSILSAILSLAVAALAYFIKRFINRTDKGFESVNERIDEQSDEMRALTKDMSIQADKIRESSTTIKEHALSFQLKTNEDLKKLHEHVMKVRQDVAGISSQTASVGKDFDRIIKELESHYQRVATLSKFAYETQSALKIMKSEIVELKNAVLVREKKNGS